MAECFKCGVSEEKERLFDAISNKGVIKLCRSCASDENIPLVQPIDVNKPERVKSVYERLSDMANIDPQKHRSMLLEKAKQDSMKRTNLRERREVTLKGVIDSNYQKNKLQPRTDLVPNFHWVIMRSRRAKKLSQKQLAENIGEPEALIVSAENGIIANTPASDAFIKKLENYFGAKLRNVDVNESPSAREARERLEKEGKFDKDSAENLTISDLQEVDKKKGSESKGFWSFFRRNRKKKEEDTEEESEEISSEEADKILYGK